VALAWRLVVDPAPAAGVWNMAVDRAIQSAREQGRVGPTLRIYTWARPTVSLGRFQDVSGIDVDLCQRHGIDIVRRFTGGRGVLHADEVTYSVVASTDDGVPRGVAASYRHLCSGLAEAYRILGVEAALTQRPRGDRGSSACYLHATPADLSVGVRKLSGSAQVWLGTTVLQHGSFTISRDVSLEAEVFRLDEEARRALDMTTATLADSTGAGLTHGEVADAVRRGFETGLGISLLEGGLTPHEIAEARSFVEEAEREVLGGTTRYLNDLGLE
jgi:lipoyl(octanoyl) transferase